MEREERGERAKITLSWRHKMLKMICAEIGSRSRSSAADKNLFPTLLRQIENQRGNIKIASGVPWRQKSESSPEMWREMKGDNDFISRPQKQTFLKNGKLRAVVVAQR